MRRNWAVLALGDQREPKAKAIQSGGRPGRVNAAVEATAVFGRGCSRQIPTRRPERLRRTGANSIDGARSRLARSRGKIRRQPGLKRRGGQTAEGFLDIMEPGRSDK